MATTDSRAESLHRALDRVLDTSESAKKAWESRRSGGGAVPSPAPAAAAAGAAPTRYGKNPKGHKVPIYTAADLTRMGVGRRDATLHEIWPSSGKPGPNVFYFEMPGGDQRPSVLVSTKR